MEEKTINRTLNPKVAIVLLVLFALAMAGFLLYEIAQYGKQTPLSLSLPDYIQPRLNEMLDNKSVSIEARGIKKFSSEEEFKVFLSEVKGRGGIQTNWGGSAAINMAGNDSLMRQTEEGVATAGNAPAKADIDAPDRVSETNVQVAGIDEPDIVKTDGKQIYYSPKNSYYWPVYERKAGASSVVEPQGTTYNINAFPPTALKIAGSIDKQGDLLLIDGTLLVFSGNQVAGYDVADAQKPRETWKMRFEDNNQLVGTRLYGGGLYLVVRSVIDAYNPCPLKPLTFQDNPMVVQCRDIYYPENTAAADVVYHAMLVEPKTGVTKKSLSFVGSSSESLMYMSGNAIYVTWGYAGDFAGFIFDFLSEKGKGLVSDAMIEKLGRLRGYDISDAAKFTEISSIINNYSSSLDADGRTRFENEMTNRMADYAKMHYRDLEKTGVAKIDLSAFTIAATGAVPGKPLNQFAMDEYNGNLRIATTVGGNWSMFGPLGESANDIYVLDGEMREIGSLQGLGLTERIYSARFIEDRGYLVTFRQTDPFYVVDLSVPSKPELKGELKIPGYSSYLHPVSKNLVLGIGMENWQVKLSLYDVSIAAKPAEISKYILAENWTEAGSNHHAFLMDQKNQLFFLPGAKAGYVFTYKNNALSLAKAVAGVNADRAVYINNLLYIVASDKITVIDEATFQKVAELVL